MSVNASPAARHGMITKAFSESTAKIATAVMCEYIWIDAEMGYRSKTKVIHGNKTLKVAGDFPSWNFDGSSTGQAPGEDSEVIIIPRAIYRDPFRGGKHVLVMCDCWTPKKEGQEPAPILTNTRAPAAAIFEQKQELVPWFGIEQEYTRFKEGHPLGWPRASARSFGGPCVQIGFPGPQGPYYCSAGADVAFGRDIVEAHLKACLYAGINVSGINAEVMPGQWEYQVGPCVGIEAGDQLSVSRYILNRVCENYDVTVSLDPKPVPGDWNGAGCHTNFSTVPMRDNADGLKNYIIPAIEKMRSKHKEHIDAYGEGNERRMTGAHETASIDQFTYGVANRGASVRIGNETAMDGKGYFEDRRPASNMDPYRVTSLIFKTTCL